MTTPTTPTATRSFLSSARWRWIRRAATVLVLLGVVEYVVLPQVAGTRAALDLIGSVSPVWAALAIGLEALSLVSYSLLTRSVLPDRRPSMSWLLRTDATALGVGHVVPGGSAAATTLRYRLLRKGGAPAGDVAVGMAVQGIASVLALIALWWVSLVASIVFLDVRAAYVWIASVTAALGVVAAAAMYERSRRPDRPRHALDHVIARLPPRIRPRVTAATATARTQFDDLVANPHDLRLSALWAAGNWLFDAASLWVFLAAFGHVIDPITVFVAYGLANLLAALPLTPGGIGIVEATLISSLVGVGTPRAAAVVGVISWRLFEFWAPIPLAGLAYLSLRVQGSRAGGAGRRRPVGRSALTGGRPPVQP